MVWSNSSILSEPESTLLSQQGTWEKQWVSFGARLMELYITVKNTGSLQLEVMLMTH